MAINPRQLHTIMAPFVNVVYTLQALVQWGELYVVATLAMDDTQQQFQASKCGDFQRIVPQLWEILVKSERLCLPAYIRSYYLVLSLLQKIMGITSKNVPFNNTYIRELVMRFMQQEFYLSRTSAPPCVWVDEVANSSTLIFGLRKAGSTQYNKSSIITSAK
ncbi:unnamed protein product [Umbelopsis ramanniana]